MKPGFPLALQNMEKLEFSSQGISNCYQKEGGILGQSWKIIYLKTKIIFDMASIKMVVFLKINSREK